MAARLGIEIYEWVNRLWGRLAAKPNADGIMQIPNQEVIRDLSNDILTKFMKHNVPRDALKSENDIKKIYNQIKNIEEQTLAKNLKTALTPQKTGDVLDLTGKKIDTSKPILGGKNVPETEEQILERLNRQNKESVERLKNKKLTDPEDLAYGGVAGMLGERTNYSDGGNGEDDSMVGISMSIEERWERIKKLLKQMEDIKSGKTTDPNPEDFAHGGRTGTGLNYLLGEDDQNMRVPFGKGKLVDVGRRLFLQAVGAGAAGIGAAKSGLLGLLKGGKKEVVESLTSVPIGNAPGMPPWFKPLVNRVIKEGEEIGSSVERQIVHEAKLPNSKTPIHVTQDLNTGNVSVDIGVTKHGFPDGHLGQPVALEYRASEWIEPTIKKGKSTKGQKTKEEFWVEEAEFSGGHPENVKFEDSTFEKFGQHGSDFTEVEKFATGKVKKAKPLKKREATQWNEGSAQAEADAAADLADDFASGGRVPMIFGGSAGLRGLWKKLMGPKSKTLFPKIKKDRQELGRLVDPKTMDSIESLNLQQLENMLEALKIDKRSITHIAETKAMKDPGLDFLMGKMKEDKSFGLDFDQLAKYTDIDNDIMVVEQMIKNKTMKGRKPNATGGRVPLAGGKIVGTILSLLKNPKKIRAAVDDIFSSGDYKMDAEMASQALVENNPTAFGGKLIDDLDDATRSEIYGAVLKVVQSDLAKTLQLKRLSKPTKTLEGIEKTGTINISDDAVADEFSRFMKETDPKGFKDIEQKIQIESFDPKGRKKNATGGLAGMLGE
jgi:hypothetical protein